MYRIKNTAEDRTKHILHRKASKFELEPSFGGVRIRLNSHIDISDERYEKSKALINEWVGKGMVDVIKLPSEEELKKEVGDQPELLFDDNGLRLDGPTFEQWINAGYRSEDYPPQGYAELPCIALTNFKLEQAKKSIADAEAASFRKIEQQTTEQPIVETVVSNTAPPQEQEVVVPLPPTVTTLPPPPVIPAPQVSGKIEQNKGKKNLR